MMMVGSSNKNGVDLAMHLIEHFSIIGKGSWQRLAETSVLIKPFDLSKAAIPGSFNHIANRYQVFAHKCFDMGTTPSTHANTGNVELGIG